MVAAGAKERAKERAVVREARAVVREAKAKAAVRAAAGAAGSAADGEVAARAADADEEGGEHRLGLALTSGAIFHGRVCVTRRRQNRCGFPLSFRCMSV